MEGLHKEQAELFLQQVAARDTTGIDDVARAQVHATLALVEEVRILRIELTQPHVKMSRTVTP